MISLILSKYPVLLVHMCMCFSNSLLCLFSLTLPLYLLVLNLLISDLHWINMLTHVLCNLLIAKLLIFKQFNCHKEPLVVLFTPLFYVLLYISFYRLRGLTVERLIIKQKFRLKVLIITIFVSVYFQINPNDSIDH